MLFLSSSKLSSVSTPGTSMELSSGLAHASMAVPDVQGCQKQCMSNDAVADCGRAKNRRVSDFSVKAASVSGMSVAAAEKERYPCELCDKTYTYAKSLTRHKKNKHAKDYKDMCVCDDCGKPFMDRMALFRHRGRVHDKNKQGKEGVYNQCSQWSQCSQCSQIFPDPEALRQHISSDHTKKENYKFACTRCGRTYRKKNALDKHLFSRHGINQKGTGTSMCSLCGKAFLHKSGLLQHMTSHGRNKPYQCQKCSRKFTEQRYMERHDRHIHNHDYPYSCGLCSHPGFSNLQQFRQHMESSHPFSLPKDSNGDSGGGKPERNPGLFNRA